MRSILRFKRRRKSLPKLRCKDPDKVLQVIRESDEGFEDVIAHAIRGPFFDAIETRLRFTPPDELDRLIEGLRYETERRREEK